MKNKNLWLSLLIFTAVMFLLSWIIPATDYNESGALAVSQINPVGIWDIGYFTTMLLPWFGQNAVFLIAMGAFYGIISNTNAFKSLVEKIAEPFKKKENLFLVVSSGLFILVSSITGVTFPLLFFVPLVIGVILRLGFGKITALTATVFSILVGSIGSLYVAPLYASLSSAGVENAFIYGWYKLGLILASLVAIPAYLFLTSKIAKGKEKENIAEEELLLTGEGKAKKVALWPLVTTYIVILVLFILGFTSWSTIFNFNGFVDFNTKLLEFKIGDFSIFGSILGTSLVPFGTWNAAQGVWTAIPAVTIILIATIILIFIYKIDWEEVYKGFVSGVNKLMPAIILVTVANIAFIIASQSGFIITITHFLSNITDSVNSFTYSLASFIGASVVNENYVASHITSTMIGVLGQEQTAQMPILVFIQQMMSGVAMLVAPTSAVLIFGLTYLDVSYTNWLKKMWIPIVVIAAVVVTIISVIIFIA